MFLRNFLSNVTAGSTKITDNKLYMDIKTLKQSTPLRNHTHVSGVPVLLLSISVPLHPCFNLYLNLPLMNSNSA